MRWPVLARPTGTLPVARASGASPWLSWLLEQHARGLTAKRIHQDLQSEFPGAGSVSYDSVRRLLRKQGATLPVPFRRMECGGTRGTDRLRHRRSGGRP